ncbi:thioredoxin-disulfide reductase [Xanthobacter sp. 126]|uniref:thioredoxin-disulfide reductase n=1 Tax=Xanthobacter sp. 126 TaxID=1131814 RepID=UPI00045E9282|nr:thioredoxin-disulfide reductase [Xanthobacter sp. 126]
MTNTYRSKVLIIGSGAAGYTAAIYASRANLKPILIRGMQQGGQLTITTDVENYPGFAQTIQGPWLMEQMHAQALHMGTQTVDDSITAIDFSARPFTARGESGDKYISETVIVATGASAKWLGLESEKKLMGLGVSACATCDGFFYRNRHVAVVGGGNTAVEEALYLTNFASKVTLIHRRDSLKAEQILQERLFENKKVELIWDSTVHEILDDPASKLVRAVRLRNVKTGELSDTELQGVFVAIGHQPNTDLFKGQLTLDAEGYIVTTPGTQKTNIPGVFAAGDVQDPVYRQAITAAGSGCMSALDAERFLAHTRTAKEHQLAQVTV